MSARKFAADKLLWETLARWKRSSPELDRIQFLKTVPFFDRLSNRQLKTVSDIMFERSYDSDESIFEEGQPGAALFLILDGKIAIEIYRETSTTRLAVLESGAFFGEMALLDAEPRVASITTVEPTHLLRLDQAPFFELIADRPEVAIGLIHVLTRRLRAHHHGGRRGITADQAGQQAQQHQLHHAVRHADQ